MVRDNSGRNNPPSPTGGSPVPSWIVRFHKEYARRLEEWAAEKLGRTVSLGQVYGCGHYGCVYELPGEPWVLKLTRDPNEGPIWQKIRQYDLDGFARVKAVARLDRELRYRKNTGPVYAIIREDVAPLKGEWTSEHGWWSDYTRRKVESDPSPDYASRSLVQTTRALRRYQEHATSFVARKRGREQAAQAALSAAEAELMSEPYGYAIGEALSRLGHDGIFLRDVHVGNVGWRQHPVVDGDEKSDQGLVIYDPGHTPAEPLEVPVLNPRPDKASRRIKTRRHLVARRKSKRKNPLSEGYLAKLPAEARSAFESGGRWGTRPRQATGQPWPSQDEAGLWGRYSYGAGWLVEDGRLHRTVWRFDDSETPTLVDTVDVDSDDYLTIIGGYSEEERVAAWRDYYAWVIENGVDPLDELKVSDSETAVHEPWSLVLKEFERGDVPVAVELVGAKPSEGPVRTPETVPAWLSKRLSLSLEKSTGAWIIGNYASLAELLPELEAQGGQVVQSEDGVAKVLVEFRLEPSDSYTPRTEAIREAAREALAKLPAAANPRRRKNPQDDRLSELEHKVRMGDKLTDREVREMRRIRRALFPRKRKTPGHFFAPWETLIQALGATLSDSQEIALIDGSSVAAKEWIRESGLDLSPEQEDEVYRVFSDSIVSSVSSVSVVKTVLERLADDINRWSDRGPQSAIYERRQRHKTGKAIDVRWNDEGAEIQLFRPFLQAFSEASFCVNGIRDEGEGLEAHADVASVIACARWIRRCEGSQSIRDEVQEEINDAAQSWSWPSDKEIEAAVEEVGDLVDADDQAAEDLT